MTNTNELTAKLKAAALKAKAATEDYAAGRISITTCYSECAEFNSLTDGPDQILPLIEALEAAQSRIAELEARALTVKLPKASRVKLVSGEYVHGWKAYDVTCAISNAGIKLQIEGE